MIRKAKISDVRAIHKILSLYAKQGILLGRSLSDLYDQLRDFIVYIDAQSGQVEATCALNICWEDIAEIRSLAVARDYCSKGIARKMVQCCLDEASQLGIEKVFVLTYVPDFFKKMGFHPVDKSVLPHKVWADCIKCVKFPDCEEDALMIEIRPSMNAPADDSAQKTA